MKKGVFLYITNYMQEVDGLIINVLLLLLLLLLLLGSLLYVYVRSSNKRHKPK